MTLHDYSSKRDYRCMLYFTRITCDTSAYTKKRPTHIRRLLQKTSNERKKNVHTHIDIELLLISF